MKRICFILTILIIPCILNAEVRHKFFSKEWTNFGINNLNDNFNDIDDKKQNSEFRIFTSTPASSDLFDGEVVLMNTTTIKRIYTRFASVLYYVDLTVAP